MNGENASHVDPTEKPAPLSTGTSVPQTGRGHGQAADTSVDTSGSSIDEQRTPVIVFGDMQFDTVVVDHVPPDVPATSLQLNWREDKQRHVLSIRRPGGIWLVAKTIRNAALESEPNGAAEPETTAVGKTEMKGARKKAPVEVFAPDEDGDIIEKDHFNRDFCPESLARLALFPRKMDSKSDDKVYRINGPVIWVNQAEPVGKAPIIPSIEKWVAEARQKLPEPAKAGGHPPPIVVLWDRNNGFRHDWSPDGKPNSEKGIRNDLREFLQQVAKGGGTIVWQRAAPFGSQGDPLWKMIVDESNYAIRNNTIVIVRAKCLRRAGMIFEQNTSIEQIVENFAAGLKESPLGDLAQCRHLIVWLEDGAILLSNTNDRRHGGSPIRYFYCPNTVDEVSSTDRGIISGNTVILTAAIVRELAAVPATDNGRPHYEQRLQQICEGIRLGVVLAPLHCRQGYGTEENVKNTDPTELTPFPRLFAQPQTIRELGYPKKVNADYLVAALEFPPPHDVKKRLSRCDVFLNTRPEIEIRKTLFQAVTDGLERVGRQPRGEEYEWLLQEEITYPYGTFGSLVTADRHEVEGYMAIYRLIRNYDADRKVERPVSIATFGPPGAGKSFAIKSIVESIDPAAARSALEFNIAQFTDVRDLTAVFHQAQDRTIEGVLPLIIFDEFDAALQKQKLGWLKQFLAPMQDGLFKDGTRMYRVGRAIFLFSGGTQDTFEAFREPEDDREFRDAKGPDFVSRLRGYLNVETIDSRGDEIDSDLMFRRATLLRSILKRKRSRLLDGDTLRVDESVIHAFLTVPRYRHGVRSMEAIVEMSNATSIRFEKSDLPAPSQLKLHVDVDKFLQRLNDV